MNSLLKINNYSDSDSAEESEERHQSKLPLPSFLVQSTVKKPYLSETNSDGKIRNFPHEPGNWATYICAPLNEPSELPDYLAALIRYFKPLNLKFVDDFHISLSKTVILRHHWIADFTKSVQTALTDISQFKIYFCGLKAYTNEQKTRSFLSLKVCEGEGNLKALVTRLDKCLKDYNLQCFYENPSFHVSLLWCPGEKCNEISKYIDSLPSKLKSYSFNYFVSHCICVSGNKKFKFPFNQ